jgi:hypothetical protein
VPGFDRQIRIERGAAALARGRRLPHCKCLGGDPYGQAATILQRLVVLAPVPSPDTEPSEICAVSRFVHLVGHVDFWASVSPYPAIFTKMLYTDLCTNAVRVTWLPRCGELVDSLQRLDFMTRQGFDYGQGR